MLTSRLTPSLAGRIWLVVALGAGLSFIAGCPQPHSAICPSGRVCPSPYTCALHQDAVIIENGRATARWKVLARDRMLSI